METRNMNDETFRGIVGLNQNDWKAYTDCLTLSNDLQLEMMATMILDECVRRGLR